MNMNRLESVPPTPSPEQPPLAPYDPPEPAPQAAAWRRALRVVVNASLDPSRPDGPLTDRH
jgi:hypothetical protein